MNFWSLPAQYVDPSSPARLRFDRRAATTPSPNVLQKAEPIDTRSAGSGIEQGDVLSGKVTLRNQGANLRRSASVLQVDLNLQGLLQT